MLVLDLLHSISADDARNLGSVRVDPWGSGEESLKVDFRLNLLLQRLFVVAGEPVDDGMNLCLRAPFLLRLGDIVRIDTRESHSEYPCIVHTGIYPSGITERVEFMT